MYCECTYHTLPKFIMFTSVPVKHFPPLIIPSTSTSYLLLVSAEDKDYIVSVIVHPVPFSAAPVMWSLLWRYGELISAMLVTRLERTKRKREKKDLSPILRSPATWNYFKTKGWWAWSKSGEVSEKWLLMENFRGLQKLTETSERNMWRKVLVQGIIVPRASVSDYSKQKQTLN